MLSGGGVVSAGVGLPTSLLQVIDYMAASHNHWDKPGWERVNPPTTLTDYVAGQGMCRQYEGGLTRSGDGQTV